MKTTERGRWLVPLVLVLSMAAIGAWRCPIAAVLHFPCPTCGMTRAVSLALHGDFRGATAMHPLVWIVVPSLAAWLVLEIRGYFRTGTWGATSEIRGSTAFLVILSVLLFAVWLARFYGAFGGPAPV